MQPVASDQQNWGASLLKNGAVGTAQSMVLERLNTIDIMESLDGNIGKLHDAQ